jgi:hypothetical protein
MNKYAIAGITAAFILFFGVVIYLQVTKKPITPVTPVNPVNPVNPVVPVDDRSKYKVVESGGRKYYRLYDLVQMIGK